MGGVHRQAGSEHGPAVLRGRRALTGTVVVLVLATLAGLFLLRPTGRSAESPQAGERLRATVTAAATAPCDDASPGAPADGPRELCVDLTLRWTRGRTPGRR